MKYDENTISPFSNQYVCSQVTRDCPISGGFNVFVRLVDIQI